MEIHIVELLGDVATRIHFGCEDVAFRVEQWAMEDGWQINTYTIYEPIQLDESEMMRVQHFMNTFTGER